jgi:hypothetical protein
MNELCYKCCKRNPINYVSDIEFNQDGRYCSKECLTQEYKDVEAREKEFNEMQS